MNSGVILPILQKTRFEYSYLAVSASQAVIIQPAIDTSPFYYYQLIVRVHERSFSGSQTIQLALASTLPSEEDPREFSASAASTIRYPPKPITATTASWLSVVYHYDPVGKTMVPAAGQPQEARSITTGNYSQMKTWFSTLMQDTFK